MFKVNVKLPEVLKPKRVNREGNILQAPQSQTSFSLGPLELWRHTPGRPHRSAASRYPPDCPPTTGKASVKNELACVGDRNRTWTDMRSYLMQMCLFLLCWKAKVLLQDSTVFLCLFVILFLSFLSDKSKNPFSSR